MILPLKHYVFWLCIISVACFVAERILPWRKEQGTWRPQFSQDMFWLIFNGYVSGFIFIPIFKIIHHSLEFSFKSVSGLQPENFKIISTQPLWLQVLVVLVLADFIEWMFHNALHRVAWLWKIHRVHHSIVIMDWIGNFRFHWAEILFYKSLKYLPLLILGARWEAVLIHAVITTTIGHINHANLNISWGPFRYILNSPRMHIWHHEKELRGKAGVNFGIVFSIWDWIFRTAYMPEETIQPKSLGYVGMNKVPTSLFMRFLLPWANKPKNSD